jgi:hypothetical protein
VVTLRASNGTQIGVNQTTLTGSFTGLTNDTYTAYVTVVGDNGASDTDQVIFTVAVPLEPEPTPTPSPSSLPPFSLPGVIIVPSSTPGAGATDGALPSPQGGNNALLIVLGGVVILALISVTVYYKRTH